MIQEQTVSKPESADNSEREAGSRAPSCSPYYADEWVTIYHADARELLPSLADYILVTDPPYGVDMGKTKGSGGKHGLKLEGYECVADDYDTWKAQVLPVISEAVKRAKRGCVFTGPHEVR